MDLKISFKVALLAGLAWTLGGFLGEMIQYIVSNFILNPIMRLFMG